MGLSCSSGLWLSPCGSLQQPAPHWCKAVGARGQRHIWADGGCSHCLQKAGVSWRWWQNTEDSKQELRSPPLTR